MNFMMDYLDRIYNMNTARFELGADGLQTAAIGAGGRVLVEQLP